MNERNFEKKRVAVKIDEFVNKLRGNEKLAYGQQRTPILECSVHLPELTDPNGQFVSNASFGGDGTAKSSK